MPIMLIYEPTMKIVNTSIDEYIHMRIIIMANQRLTFNALV